MTSIYAYYNGHNYITEGSLAIKPNQKVIITILDDFVKPKRNLKKYIGAVNKEDSDIISKVVEEGRKVDINEW